MYTGAPEWTPRIRCCLANRRAHLDPNHVRFIWAAATSPRRFLDLLGGSGLFGHLSE